MTRPDRTASAPRRDDRDAREAGFTLIEVIVVMAILLVVTTGIYRAFNTSTKTVTGLQTMIEEQAKARNVLSGLQSEVRNAFSGVTNVSSIVTIGPSTLEFTSADRTAALKLRKIKYTLASGVLSRTAVTSNETYNATSPSWTWPAATAIPVLTGVQNTTLFVFRDASNAVTTDPAAVRQIEITLTVKYPTAPANQQPETYSTTIRLRGTG